MAKISQLPLEIEPDGSEAVVMVKNGMTRRGTLGGLVGASVVPHVAATQIARDQAADIVLPRNIFVARDLATARANGEAALAEGVYFKAVGEAERLSEVRKRTSSGSDLLYVEATTAALASPNGGYMVGLEQGGMVADAIKYVTPQMLGAVGNTLANDTVALDNAVAAAAALGLELRVEGGSFLVGTLTLPPGLKMRFGKDGVLVAAESGTVLTFGGDNITLTDANIDLNNTAFCGIAAQNRKKVRLLGTTTIRNAATGGHTSAGGISLDRCDDAIVGDVDGFNLYQNGPGVPGLYQTLEASNCTSLLVGTVSIRGGDMGALIYACQGWDIKAVRVWTITDNAVYIADNTGSSPGAPVCRDGHISEVLADGVGEGVVFNSGATDANILIDSVTTKDASVRGISLRRGGGYHVGQWSGVEAGLGQSAFYSPAVVGLTIGSATILQKNTTNKAVVLERNTGITFGLLEVFANNPSGGDPVRFTGSDRITVGTLRIVGIGASPIAVGLRIEAGAGHVAAPKITIGRLVTENVTEPYVLNVPDTANVQIMNGSNLYGNVTVRSDQTGGPQLQLRSSRLSVSAGDVIGRIDAYSSDSSSPGVKGALEWRAAGGNGGAGSAHLLNDLGDEVMRVSPSGGVSIRLETNPSNVASGFWYDNAGTLTKKP